MHVPIQPPISIQHLEYKVTTKAAHLVVQCTLLWEPIIRLEELNPPIWISNKIMQRLEIGSSVYNLFGQRRGIKGDRKINQKRKGQNACEVEK